MSDDETESGGEAEGRTYKGSENIGCNKDIDPEPQVVYNPSDPAIHRLTSEFPNYWPPEK